MFEMFEKICLNEPPLSKHLPWAVSQIDTGNKSNGFRKRSTGMSFWIPESGTGGRQQGRSKEKEIKRRRRRKEQTLWMTTVVKSEKRRQF